MLPRVVKPRPSRSQRRPLSPSRRQLAATAVLALLAVLLLVDAYNWGLLMPHFTYHAYRRRWVRVHTARDWRRVAAAKAALPRYRPPASPQHSLFPFPIKVLSLLRSKDRRLHAEQQLQAQNIPFQFVDAVDGDNLKDLPEPDVQRYFSGERLQKYRAGTSNARFKVGCDLSHFMLMHALLTSRNEAQLVLEDDFELPPAGDTLAGAGAEAEGRAVGEGQQQQLPFMQALNATLHELPADWDVLHLTLCQAVLGGEVGRGVRVFSRGFCTLGLLYTRAAAFKALREAEVGTRNVDNILMDLAEIGELNAYVADPPLVAKAELFKSEIDRDGGAKDPF